MTKDENLMKIDLLKESPNNHFSRNELIKKGNYSLKIEEENGEEVPYPGSSFYLSEKEVPLLNGESPFFGLNELYWKTNKNLSTKELAHIFLDLIPDAKEELKETYSSNVIDDAEIFIKDHNLGKSIKDKKFSKNLTRKNLDNYLNYDKITFLTLQTFNVAMSLNGYEKIWTQEKGTISIYFDHEISKTFQKLYTKTTGRDLQKIVSNFNQNHLPEQLLLK